MPPRKRAEAKPKPADHPDEHPETPTPASESTPPAEVDPAELNVELHVRRQLAKLRESFPDNAVSHLPKLWCRSCKDSPRKHCNDHSFIRNCPDCGGRHSEAVIHLDYVGHADVTGRLLDIDPWWDWAPVTDEALLARLPCERGGMWIELTVLGVTRLGYGDSDGKTGHSAIKEIIGDAIRNAAMRFGVALAMWSKSDALKTREEADHGDGGIGYVPPVEGLVQKIFTAAALLDKTPEDLTRKFRAAHGDITVEGLIEVDPVVLLEFTKQLEPYVWQAKHEGRQEAREKARDATDPEGARERAELARVAAEEAQAHEDGDYDPWSQELPGTEQETRR